VAKCDMCRKEVEEHNLCKIQAECTPEKKSYFYQVCPECLLKLTRYIENK